MRRLLLPFVVLLVLLLLGSDSPKEYDGTTEYIGIEGTWRLIEYDFKGNKTNPQCVRTFRNETYTTKWRQGDTWRGNYRIDLTPKTPHLDLNTDDGPTLLYIYQIDGDTLRMASLENSKNARRGSRMSGLLSRPTSV